MIRQIRGTIVHVTDALVEVDVHGIGYLIHASFPTEHLVLGSEISFVTHLAVRETALDLYGFTDRDSLQVFELLITLPKIGPKSAIQILRQADINLLKQAVRNDDASYLSKMSGIGKKSAEKIVVGLKEKFENSAEEIAPSAGAGDKNGHVHDTIDALVMLGYTQDDARRTVKVVVAEHPDVLEANEMIRRALKILGSS